MQTATPQLSHWHCVQAAMLYHFASLGYLKLLHHRVNQLIGGVVDPMLDLARAQNRDSVLVDPQWGNRNTSENWANHAWPFLKDFQASLAKDIARRAVERYARTSANDCLRGIDEYSMQWATPQEEQVFQDAIRAISAHAINIDCTLDDYHNSRWKDSSFAFGYPEFAAQHPMIPRYRIRTDIAAESHKTPPRTGVYIAQDDPNAALQFAWTGNGGGKLRPAKTFNDLGLDALRTVGRADLWLNDQKMYEFATSKKYAPMFSDQIKIGGRDHRRLASPSVAQVASTDRPCKWFFLETLEGEFQDVAFAATAAEILDRERLKAGEICEIAGYYFTPAQLNSRRRFVKGEIVPNHTSAYGETIWQWDQNQEP